MSIECVDRAYCRGLSPVGGHGHSDGFHVVQLVAKARPVALLRRVADAAGQQGAETVEGGVEGGGLKGGAEGWW